MNVPSDLYCPVCELSVNSQQQLTQHLGSTKHKLVSLGLLPKPSEDPNIKRVGQYKCKTCDVILNSEAQLVQHLKSLRHQAAERGEELPPRGERRFCPYQRNNGTSKKPKDAESGGALVLTPTASSGPIVPQLAELNTTINAAESPNPGFNDLNGNHKKLSNPDVSKEHSADSVLIDSKDSVGNSRSPSYKSTEN